MAIRANIGYTTFVMYLGTYAEIDYNFDFSGAIDAP